MIGKNDIKDMYFLSPMQEGMLFHYLMDKESPAYFEQMSYRICGELDYQLFEQSFNRLIQRYDVLRTIFVYEKVQRPLQVILKPRKTSIFYEDVSYLNGDELERWVMEFKRKDKARGFKLEKDILIRLAILRISDKRYEIIWSFHHILMDGWCISILVKDMLITYYSLIRGKTVNLVPPVAYKNYIIWLEKQDKDTAINYWKRYLEDYETQAVIPRDTKGKINKYEMRVYEFGIDRALTKEFIRLSNENNVTVSTIFQTLWGILLQRYNNTDDVVFGSVVSGRPAGLRGVETMVGLFINTIPVRVKKGYEDTFVKLLGKNQALMIQSRAYEFVPLAEIQSKSLLKRELVNHIVIFENYPLDKEIKDLSRDNISLFSVESVEVSEQTNYDLNIFVAFMEELVVKIQYNTAVYNDNVIIRIEEHLVGMFKQVTLNSEIPVEKIEIISASEKKQVLFDFNRTETRYPKDKTIHGLFEEQMEKTLDSIAVIGSSVSNASSGRCIQLTYRELNEGCHQFARILQKKGVQPDAIVGIMVERSIEMIASILAILKAGGAYLPIDLAYPLERVKYILKDSNAVALICRKSAAKFLENICQLIDLKNEKLYPFDKEDLKTLVTADDEVYVTYTSGSTGKPKGVIITHRSMANFIKGIIDIIPFEPDDVILTLTTISFDIFGLETILPLTRGAKVIIGTREQQLEIGTTALVLEREGITKLQVTPSRLQMFMAEPGAAESLKTLKYLLVGGEAFPPELLAMARRIVKGKIYNLYGPTETTIWSTSKDLTGDTALNIGTPLANTSIYILNQGGGLQPIGMIGELCIAGDGVARGYLNKPELTDEKFIPNHFLKTGRLYRTGDLARWLPDGNIEFLGRIDNQVKIRGYRIETGEIENKLLQHQSIKEALVIAVDNNDGGKELCSYFISRGEVTLSALREHLAESLPGYMIPTYFVQLAQIPLTPNGKVDHRALPGPELKKVGTYEAPRDDIETKLVEIWIEILGIASASSRAAIGIDNNFFELGGHSLKAIVLAARIHKEFNVKVPLTVIFKTLTVRGLSGYIKDISGTYNGWESKYTPLEASEKKDYYPVSLTQKRFYMIQYLNPANISYNLAQPLILEGCLDKDKMEKTFKGMIRRHESLRTSFELVDGEPVQKVPGDVEFTIEYQEAPEDKAVQLVNRFIRPFSLDKAPLFRVKLIKFAEDRHLFIIDMHHIITDGLSFVIFSTEFIKLYEGQALPPVSFQYRDFSEWQNSEHEKKRLNKQGKFWIKQFADGIPLLNLRTDFPRPPVQSNEGDVINFIITLDETELLRQLVLHEKSSIFMVLFTIYIILLWRLSGQTDIVIGTGALNRTHVGLMTIPGLFFNTLPLRNHVAENMSFKKFLKTVKGKTLEAFENQEYPLDMLAVELTARGGFTQPPNRTPFFDTMFAEQNFADAIKVDSGARLTGLTIRHFSFEKNLSRFDLFLQIAQAPDVIHMRMEYSTSLFKPSTAQQILENYMEIVNQVLEDKEIKLKDITISSNLVQVKSTVDQKEYMNFGF